MTKIDIAEQVELVESISKKLKDDIVIDNQDTLSAALDELVKALKPLGEGHVQKYEELCSTIDGIHEYSNGFAMIPSTVEEQRNYLRRSIETILKIKNYIVGSIKIADENREPKKLVGTDDSVVEEQKEVTEKENKES